MAMAPLRASLDLFDRAGAENLRAKSRKLTAYLQEVLEEVAHASGSVLGSLKVGQKVPQAQKKKRESFN